MVNITVVETLGDIVAFKNNEVQVLKSVYEQTEENMFKEDFDCVLDTAYNAYKSFVASEKSEGKRPNASKIKKEVVEVYIKKFLRDRGLYKEGLVTRVRASKPRIPSDNEVVKISKKESYLRQIDSVDEIESLFNQSDLSELEERRIETPDTSLMQIDEDLFEEGDLLDDLNLDDLDNLI